MTSAPANLLAVRSLLLTHLDNAPGSNDLEPAEVGIVGDPAHRGGYHCGSDRVLRNDYSVVESSRDRNGLSDYAAGLDVGDFSVTANGRTHNLRTFSVWCAQQCAAKAPDARDIREIIYSPDGSTVKRWDALGRRSSGDSSHRWHTHFSFFRDAIKAGRDQRPLFRRYLTTIGLIEPPQPQPPVEEPEMELTDKLIRDTGRPQRTVDDVLADLANLRNWLVSAPGSPGVVGAPDPASPVAVMAAASTGGTSVDLDEEAIIAGVLAGLPADFADQIAAKVAGILAARLAD